MALPHPPPPNDDPLLGKSTAGGLHVHVQVHLAPLPAASPAGVHMPGPWTMPWPAAGRQWSCPRRTGPGRTPGLCQRVPSMAEWFAVHGGWEKGGGREVCGRCSRGKAEVTRVSVRNAHWQITAAGSVPSRALSHLRNFSEHVGVTFPKIACRGSRQQGGREAGVSAPHRAHPLMRHDAGQHGSHDKTNVGHTTPTAATVIGVTKRVCMCMCVCMCVWVWGGGGKRAQGRRPWRQLAPTRETRIPRLSGHPS
jgi:hypothetical protein